MSPRGCESGFSLLEVLIASSLLAGALVSLAQLFSLAVRSNVTSREITYAATLAAQKVEELRSLDWSFDAAGAQVSDSVTDTSVYPERRAGGTGITAGGATIHANAPGYVDFVDDEGRKRPDDDAGGYVRRWSIEPLPSDEITVVLVVSVMPARAARQGQEQRARAAGEIRVTTMKTRLSP
jgi:prepilin-type N-terminal cleavage/methylation domain-containing protein